MQLLYTLFIWLYGVLIRLFSTRDPKAREWVRGRAEQNFTDGPFAEEGGDWVWFHAASLGEFEQGLPLMEKFRAGFPQYRILLTFFSPSGYTRQKDCPVADAVRYLPLDTPGRVKKFLNEVNPRAAVFIRYEFWFNYLREIKKRRIPVMVSPAIFRPGQIFFRPWGGWMRPFLRNLDVLQVQDERSFQLLRAIDVPAEVVGDSRIERVMEIAGGKEEIPWAAQMAAERPTVVVGSNWQEDDRHLIPVISRHPEWNWIIAPHEVEERNITRLMRALPSGAHRLSRGAPAGASLVVVDSIGLLSRLYRYARVAYVGGGFTDGIHSILEPAAFGCPVIFGPDHGSFAEAGVLIALGSAKSIKGDMELEAAFKAWMNVPAARERASGTTLEWMRTQAGASERMLRALEVMLS